jgi:hypothetical protein
MSTIAQNNIVREVAPKSLFESALPVLSSAVTFNQGDLIAFDNTNKVLKAVTGTGDGAQILGVAPNTVVNGLMPSPVQGTAVDGSAAIEDMAGPIYGVVAFFKATAGDAWNPGDPAYIGADAQTVTSVAGGSSIGVYQGKAVASAASGTNLDILVGCRFGLSGIQF